MNIYIGIDLGTSSVKLLLVAADGTILNTVTQTYNVYYPKDGWSEQNPEDWYSGVIGGIIRLLVGQDKSAVKGIGLGGQMHGLVILDGNDKVIRPCILWNDGRTQKQTDYLNEVIGKQKLSKHTANIAFAGFTAPKILWVRENEPESFKRIAKIMLPKDYIAYRLTGVHATDYSDASGTLLLDVKNKRWSKEMLDICGISEGQLPKLYESYQPVGNILSSVCKELQISENVVVCAGAGDNAAAAIGTGTVGNGDCNISLGTSGTVFISQDNFSVDKNNALHSFAHASGKYHLMGCILSAASCNMWWMENVLKTAEFSAEQRGADKLRGKNDLFFLPYLMGERSPHNDTDARGAFIGLRPTTTRTQMTLAVMEGVAFALRDCVEVARLSGIPVNSTRICGGGAKSPLWRQIIADILIVRVQTPKRQEGPAYGGAMLAMVACGEYKDTQAAVNKLVTVTQTVEPDCAAAAGYDKRYKIFTALYPALKNIYKNFQEL